MALPVGKREGGNRAVLVRPESGARGRVMGTGEFSLYDHIGEDPEAGKVYNVEDAQGQAHNNTGFNAELWSGPDGTGTAIQTLSPGESADLTSVGSVKFCS
ncbi:hypothetical protein ACFU7T_09660 [Streptomyces sp. NPDC057555]|uniref:hypothetical protein n=1 Tax=Streptomyces sp. NPDC057555 TaxID=3346166 RepID=UPI003680D4D7